MDQTFDAECVATARNYETALSRDAVHRIDVILHRHGQSGPYYDLAFAGEILIESTKEPLLDACRAEMWGGELYPRMMLRNIERAAKFTVVENINAGPQFAQYRPHPGGTDGR
jgi:hypothetical protein